MVNSFSFYYSKHEVISFNIILANGKEIGSAAVHGVKKLLSPQNVEKNYKKVSDFLKSIQKYVNVFSSKDIPNPASTHDPTLESLVAKCIDFYVANTPIPSDLESIRELEAIHKIILAMTLEQYRNAGAMGEQDIKNQYENVLIAKINVILEEKKKHAEAVVSNNRGLVKKSGFNHYFRLVVGFIICLVGNFFLLFIFARISRIKFPSIYCSFWCDRWFNCRSSRSSCRSSRSSCRSSTGSCYWVFYLCSIKVS